MIILYIYDGFSNNTTQTILRNRSSGSVKAHLISSSNLSSTASEANTSDATPSSHFSSTEASSFRAGAAKPPEINTKYKQFKSRTNIK